MFKENRLIYLHSPADALSGSVETPKAEILAEEEVAVNYEIDVTQADLLAQRAGQDPSLAEKTPEERQSILGAKIKNEGIIKFMGNLREIKTQFSENEIATALIDKKKGFYLLQSMAEFPGIDVEKTVDFMIQKKQGRDVGANLENLQRLGMDPRQIASDLIKTGQSKVVEIYKEEFIKKVDAAELERMIQEGRKNEERAKEREMARHKKKSEEAYDKEWQATAPERQRRLNEAHSRLEANKP